MGAYLDGTVSATQIFAFRNVILPETENYIKYLKMSLSI
jgi:vacuolar-type H+-ATPase subunit D/Vma8